MAPALCSGWVLSSGAKESGKRGPCEASSASREGGGCVPGRSSPVPETPWASSPRGLSGARCERAVPARVPAPVLPPSLPPGPALRCPGPAGLSVPDPGRAAGLASLREPSASGSPAGGGRQHSWLAPGHLQAQRKSKERTDQGPQAHLEGDQQLLRRPLPFRPCPLRRWVLYPGGGGRDGDPDLAPCSIEVSTEAREDQMYPKPRETLLPLGSSLRSMA